MTRLIGKATLQCDPDLLICVACGTQHPVKEGEEKDECRICDDPRQYVPPEGQTFTTLSRLHQTHHNVWWQDKYDPQILSVKTEPKFAIGNRAELIQTPHGNILFDLIPLLDDETVDKINSLGGLDAIVISHPHYYSTWADWSRTFSCPVYIGAPDRAWLERTTTPNTTLHFLTDTYTPILLPNHPKSPTTDKTPSSPITAILTGGHFPGSLLLHYTHYLFIADTIFPSPSATNPTPGLPSVISFSFFWSIPNRIPLHPDAVHVIWRAIKDSKLEFDTCVGAFEGMDIYTVANEEGRGTGGVRGRLLESCKIFVRAMGWKEHPVLEESLY